MTSSGSLGACLAPSPRRDHEPGLQSPHREGPIAPPAPSPTRNACSVHPRGTTPPSPSWLFRQRLKSHRWSIVARLQRLSEADRAVVAELLDAPAGAPLRVVHRWAQDWYAIWQDDVGRRRSISEARERFLRWREDAEASTVAELRQVQRRMTDERLASLSHFLRDPRWEATSNGAERAGRSFRHQQGTHYNLRSAAAIGALMDVVADELRRGASPAAELAVGRSRRGRRHASLEGELAAAASPTLQREPRSLRAQWFVTRL